MGTTKDIIPTVEQIRLTLLAREKKLHEDTQMNLTAFVACLERAIETKLKRMLEDLNAVKKTPTVCVYCSHVACDCVYITIEPKGDTVLVCAKINHQHMSDKCHWTWLTCNQLNDFVDEAMAKSFREKGWTYERITTESGVKHKLHFIYTIPADTKS